MIEIRPLEGIGNLRFGMSRAETRAVAGDRYEVFRRAPGQVTASDHYPDAGLFLGFGLDGRLFSVEAARWADLELRGVRLFGRRAADVLSDLRAAGADPEQVEGNWTVPRLGLQLGEIKEENFTSLMVSAAATTPASIEFFPGDDPAIGRDDELPLVAGRGFAGGIELGTSRDRIRAVLGAGMASVPPIGGAAQDYFMEARVEAHYDSAGAAILLIAAKPTRPTIEGMAVLGRPWSEVVSDARARGIAVVEEEAELRFPAAGCSAWPLQVTPDAPLVAVAVHA